ncbi:Thiol-disulfide oxidoreductase ResA [compost metagenome]
MLDFWASWCKPCREESPFLKTAYRKFKDNKFVIIQVSIDKPQDEAKWRKAIADDNVGEFIHTNLYPDNTVYKKYNIVSLPTNYLISPEGKIITSNLRGERLVAELERIFKH